jgi:hypothetical protein
MYAITTCALNDKQNFEDMWHQQVMIALTHRRPVNLTENVLGSRRWMYQPYHSNLFGVREADS